MDEILVGGELWRLDGFHFLERRISVCASHPAEDCFHALKQLPALFQCDDGVVKSGSIGIVGDGLYFDLLLRHASLDRGLKVFVLNLVEGRGLEGQCARREKRIGRAEVSGGGERGVEGAERNSSSSDQGAHE